MKRIFSFLVLAVLFTACLNGHESKEQTSFEAKGFNAKIEETKGVVVDVRTPTEYAEGHLEGATNMDWKGNKFDKQTATLDRSKPVLVYCHSGRRSAAAATKMREAGFEHVYELTGGILSWKSANLPVIK